MISSNIFRFIVAAESWTRAPSTTTIGGSVDAVLFVFALELNNIINVVAEFRNRTLIAIKLGRKLSAPATALTCALGDGNKNLLGERDAIAKRY